MINEQLVNILIQAVLAMVAALGIACWTVLIDFCIGSPRVEEVKRNRIFSIIGYWIREKYIAYDFKEQKRISAKDMSIRERVFRIPNPYKAMGICPLCSNVWWGFFWTVPLIFSTGIHWAWIFLFIPLSNTITRKLISS